MPSRRISSDRASTVGGTTFNLGPANTNNVVSAAGQTIALPAGHDATLELLATDVNVR